jgi:hypothetical protein
MTDHGDVNESFMVPWIALMIAHQSPRLDQPAKGSLHAPAPGQQDKTFGGVTTLDDREDQSAGVPEQSAYVLFVSLAAFCTQSVIEAEAGQGHCHRSQIVMPLSAR